MSIATPTESQSPLPTTREERGRQIAKRGGIRQLGARYVVPAQSANANVPTYLVDIVEQTCTCPDYELRRKPCKHYEACLFWLSWEGAMNLESGEIALPKKKQQSKQNWAAYRRAQSTERDRVPILLHALCTSIQDEARAADKPGRKPIPLHEGVFGIVMKVNSLCSGQVAESDIRRCHAQGLLSRPWDANTLFRVMEDPLTTEALMPLIPQSAGPVALIENEAGQFAIDSTGFRTSVRRVRDEKQIVIERWHDQKHKTDEHDKNSFIHDWVKLHAATGTVTNIVTAAHVTTGVGKGSGDSPHFIPLLNTTSSQFTVKQVSGDKGYLDEHNLTAAATVGALPFVPFKTNSREMNHPNEHWRRMWAYFDLKKEEFLKHYHRRSNVESTFGAIKAKFGGSVRSKMFVAQQNEVLAKVLLWNLTCIVQAIEEFGVEAEFSRLVMP